MGITYPRPGNPSVSVSGGGTDDRSPKAAYGTAAEWAAANPVLAVGEQGYETDTGVHKIGDGLTAWSSLTTAGSGTYAPNGVPTTAGTRTRRFSPARSTYNWKASNTRKLVAAVASARAGLALTDHLTFGDSKTSGYTSGSTGAQTAWPRAFAQCLATAGVPIAGGVATPSGPLGFGQTDARFTFGTGWTTDSFGSYAKCPTLASALTFVSDTVGTVVDIYYLDTSAPFTYSIDGAATVAVTPALTGATIKESVTGLTTTSLTVVIQSTSNVRNCVIAGINVHGTYGMQIHNMGVGGFKTSDLTTLTAPTKYYQATILAPSPSSVWIAIGVNDPGASISTATTKANLTTLLTACAAMSGSPDLFLVVESYGKTPASTWEAYIPTLYDLADTFDIPLVDLYDRFGTQPAPVTNGILYSGDQLHETATGHMAIGQLFTALALGASA